LMDAEAVECIESLGTIMVPGPEPDTLVPILDAEETENLKIARGTLNAKERRIIEDHARQTAEMLAHLDFPSKLQQVPEIASNHHERIDGKGYPRGISGEAMSIQARMLAIADVFEALTAPDRPYRKPMPLSHAVKILQSMAKEGHLDSELIEQFIDAGVHHRYAREHLTEPQRSA